MPSDVAPFTPLSATDLAAREMSPRPVLLAPFLRTESLTLLLGPRGVGKSYTALGVARAVASGEPFLGWQPSRPLKVAYVDGELSGYDLQQRLKSFGPPPAKLEFVIGGMRGNRTPDLARGNHWEALWAPWLPDKGPSLLVIDSLSSLIGSDGKEASAWTVTRRFLLYLRACGYSVLVVHDGSARGHARGSRRLEDVFDTILSLRRPDDYQPREGLRYELHFEKARGLHGSDVEPFEARMTIDAGGCAHWRREAAGSAEIHRMAGLLKDGLNPLQAAKQLGLSKSKAYRLRDKAIGFGLITQTQAFQGTRPT